MKVKSGEKEVWVRLKRDKELVRRVECGYKIDEVLS